MTEVNSDTPIHCERCEEPHKLVYRFDDAGTYCPDCVRALVIRGVSIEQRMTND